MTKSIYWDTSVLSEFLNIKDTGPMILEMTLPTHTNTITLTPTAWKPGYEPWNKGLKCDYLSDNKKKWWDDWKKENPNYKDNWKKYEKKGYAGTAQAAKKTAAKNNTTILECPHCDKRGNIGNMKRWHFDNCKNI